MCHVTLSYNKYYTVFPIWFLCSFVFTSTDFRLPESPVGIEPNVLCIKWVDTLHLLFFELRSEIVFYYRFILFSRD